MFLKQFYTVRDGRVHISVEQASRFAKEIAGDFNPLHDVDAKRFCVPGDLLFALMLDKYGLSQTINVKFSGMVGRDIPLVLPEPDAGLIEITDDEGKACMEVQYAGKASTEKHLIEAITKEYVAFSGRNFPYILVPILERHQVMFNPKRPLVIYESMSFSLKHFDIKNPKLNLVDTKLDINGKRGETYFYFEIMDGQVCVGYGEKKLLLGGLLPYDSVLMDSMIAEFNQLKSEYQS